MIIVPYRCCSSFSIQKVVNYYNNLSPEVIKRKSNGHKDSEFCMIFPPPNVTGNLHIGHALTVVVEDAVCRYQRRIGRDVTWIPGYDHAGIATQTVVERMLYREKGLSRHDLSKEDFLKYCNEWKATRKQTITDQLEKMGTSVDWEKSYYTMDENFSRAVRHAFCTLYDQGYISRAKREINYCPTMKSSISDQEVEHVTIDGKLTPICSRTGAVIQRIMKDQWFLDCTDMNNSIIDEIKNQNLNVYPQGNVQKLVDWLSNNDPWCLSRQLDWGHQIPAYQKENGDWIVSNENVEGIRDPDVLDTWFSSALIPLIVSGWPDKEITKIPLNLMETGHDIIGFWVARMLSLCRHLSGQLPFKNILLHGLIRDSSGRKMSKSLGNVIDPLDVIEGMDMKQMTDRVKESNLDEKEIEKAIKDIQQNLPNGLKAAGSDSLRFAMLRHDLLSEDINMSLNDLAQEGLRFCNKLWNLSNYSKIVFSKAEPCGDLLSKHPVDLWILNRLKITLRRIHALLDADNDCATAAPHLAFSSLRDFIVSDLCDVYLETTKKTINMDNPVILNRRDEISGTLLLVVKSTCAALEPFMPYIATYLGDHMPGESFRDINLETLFQSLPESDDILKRMNLTMALISAIRSLRIAVDVPKKFKLFGYLQGTESATTSPFTDVLNDLGNFELVQEIQEGFMPITVPGHDFSLMVQIDEDQKPEMIERLSHQLSKARAKLQQRQMVRDQLQEKLMEMQVSGTAKPHVMSKMMKKIKQANSNLESIENEVDRINNIRERIKSVGQYR